MTFTGVTWDFQQNSTRCSKSSLIHRLETNFHGYAQRFGVFLYPSHPHGSIVLPGVFVAEFVDYICLEWMQYALTVCLRSLKNA